MITGDDDAAQERRRSRKEGLRHASRPIVHPMAADARAGPLEAADGQRRR
jgi:hypothetical protein